MPKPRTIAVCLHESGSKWIPFEEYQKAAKILGYARVHAVMFDDDSIWDCINGWQERFTPQRPVALEDDNEIPF